MESASKLPFFPFYGHVIAYHKKLSAFIEKCIVESIGYMVFTVRRDCGINVVLWAPLMAIGKKFRRTYESKRTSLSRH
jgi:hypothetical protein